MLDKFTLGDQTTYVSRHVEFGERMYQANRLEVFTFININLRQMEDKVLEPLRVVLIPTLRVLEADESDTFRQRE